MRCLLHVFLRFTKITGFIVTIKHSRKSTRSQLQRSQSETWRRRVYPLSSLLPPLVRGTLTHTEGDSVASRLQRSALLIVESSEMRQNKGSHF